LEYNLFTNDFAYWMQLHNLTPGRILKRVYKSKVASILSRSGLILPIVNFGIKLKRSYVYAYDMNQTAYLYRDNCKCTMVSIDRQTFLNLFNCANVSTNFYTKIHWRTL